MSDKGKAMVPSGQNQIRLLHPVRIRGATSVVSTAPLPRMKRSEPQSADESTVLLDEIVTGTIHVADDSILVPSPSKDSEKLKGMPCFQNTKA